MQVHGVAGIGNPERFFRMLESRGMQVIRSPFPDHHAYQASDLAELSSGPVLMTEKDAVKCAALAAENHWYVPVRAELHPAFAARLMRALRAAGCATSGLDEASVNA